MRPLFCSDSAIKCVDSPCEGYMLPESNLEDARSRWTCSKCGTQRESAQVQDLLTQLAPRLEDSHPQSIPDLIRELETTSLHPNHYMIFGLKETYMYSSQVHTTTTTTQYSQINSINLTRFLELSFVGLIFFLFFWHKKILGPPSGTREPSFPRTEIH